ncbi:Hypothetical predicted protein, partial [Paramuricea clavata]
KYPVYCHMTEIPGCGTGGWTLVMKTNGSVAPLLAQIKVFNLEMLLANQRVLEMKKIFRFETLLLRVSPQRASCLIKSTFTYDSPLWTNNESYAVENGLEGLTEKESKLASYWNTPFKKICLGMTVNADRKWIMLDYEASSLCSVIADEKYRSTTAGRPAWKYLIAGSSLQLNCNEEGFSIAYNAVKVRIGYYANNQNHCRWSDSCIGFGITYTACHITSHITCGNIAQCNDNDNGHKLTAAFGYILVQ